MKIDFEQVLVWLDGNPLKDGTKDMTLQSIASFALVKQDARALESKESMRCLELAELIFKSNGLVDLDIDDLKLVRDSIARVYIEPIIRSQAERLLSGKDKKD